LTAADLDDLDAGVRRNKPDHWLASRFIADEAARADVIALYAFDHELSRAVAMKEPLMAEIRLTWWSEAIGEIFEGRAVRRHPVTLALARAVASRGLEREGLDAMIDGRFELIETPAHATEATEAALMALALKVLGADDAAAAPAAALRFGGDKAAANREARGVAAAAFPAIAYAGLTAGRPESLRRRLQLLWIILRGRF
jgi:phytoene synthase